jgi:hypothetical protein
VRCVSVMLEPMCGGKLVSRRASANHRSRFDLVRERFI